MEVVLYSTGCPKCEVLKTKLEAKNIEFSTNDNVDEMLSMGINQVPVLKVNDEFLEFSKANDWINEQ